MKYTSRGLKRRGDSDKWHVTLSHRDPLTGELVPSYHTVTARTEKQAAKRRDELILELERKGGAYTSRLTLAEFLEKFIQHKQDTMAVERSTVNHYRKQARVICRYIGGERLADVDISTVNRWMAQMVGFRRMRGDGQPCHQPGLGDALREGPQNRRKSKDHPLDQASERGAASCGEGPAVLRFLKWLTKAVFRWM